MATNEDTLLQQSTHAARSRHGMVTTPHRAASEAGAKVLRRGGTAVEAVIAAGAALTVLYPHFCGLGGDAIWIVADSEGRRDAIMGIGQAAEALPKLDGADALSLNMDNAAAQMTEVGPGVIDFARLLADPSSAAVKHFFVEHDQPAAPMASIEASLRWLQGHAT